MHLWFSSSILLSPSYLLLLLAISFFHCFLQSFFKLPCAIYNLSHSSLCNLSPFAHLSICYFCSSSHVSFFILSSLLSVICCYYTRNSIFSLLPSNLQLAPIALLYHVILLLVLHAHLFHLYFFLRFSIPLLMLLFDFDFCNFTYMALSSA